MIGAEHLWNLLDVIVRGRRVVGEARLGRVAAPPAPHPHAPRPLADPFVDLQADVVKLHDELVVRVEAWGKSALPLE